MKVRSRLHRPLPLVVTVLLAAPILATAARPQEPPPQAWEPPSMADWEYRNTPRARAIREADPTAYQFTRALFSVTERARQTREAIRLAMREGGLSRAAAESAAEAAGERAAVSGTYRFPVIVGTFAAPYSTRPYNLSDLNDRLWKPDYVSPTMLNGIAQHAHPNGSVHDYYDEVSYGRLSLTGDIYGYVQADSVVAHYVDQNGDEQLGFMDWLDQMIASVDTGATGVDFSQYDGDHDGYVDTLVLVHNLVGAESGSQYSGTTGFWSHRWYYSSVNYFTSLGGTGSVTPYTTNDPDTVNGGFIKIDDYVMQPLVNSNLSLINIGVFAHELGHAFGLPDYYDIDGSSSGGDSEGLGHWCLMASGSWRYSYSPAHMGAIAKTKLGWITPLEITDIDTLGLKVPRIEDNEFAVKVHTSQMNAQEYYLIENRQAVGFDQFLHGTGLVIYHVNDQVTTLNKNPNDLHWAIEQADGLFNLEQNINRGDGGDPWPGTTSNMEFSYTSTPSSETRAGQDSYVIVRLQDA
ncbi:M6 family metalloprotease domain-containing protein, partial [Gemmatimonadota bacterium]